MFLVFILNNVKTYVFMEQTCVAIVANIVKVDLSLLLWMLYGKMNADRTRNKSERINDTGIILISF